MGLVHPELSLDFRPTFVPKTIGDFLEGLSTIGNVSDRVSKFDEFVKRLEEEKRKIDAFKRELPLCMFLLNDAILALKEKISQVAGPNCHPLLELFSTTESDKNEEHEKEEDFGDKKNWMSSVQLSISDNYPTSKCEIKRNEEESHSTTKTSNQTRNGRKSFVPLKAYSSFLAEMPARKEEKEQLKFRGLSICPQVIKNSKEESNSDGTRSSNSIAMSTSVANFPSGGRNGQPRTCRKQRRCWSPELHRRFVNALQQIGGSQVATPKQIRELMQVDGLTNDEVKSHLQKYRLHSQKIPASTRPDHRNHSVVDLEGLHMSQAEYGEFSKGSISQSGSPQGPLHLTGNGGTSTTAGDSLEEDDEDAKSENLSWKSHLHKSGRYDE